MEKEITLTPAENRYLYKYVKKGNEKLIKQAGEIAKIINSDK